ncbi:MAG TPA: 5'-nucleotidase [Ramlibacter sp.]
MAATLDDKLVVAISSRALFDFEEENALFESGDPAAYMKLQLERLDVPARPGIAFSLIKKLLAFNDDKAQRVEVVILSRNDPVSGMRVFRSGAANEVKLVRGVFTQGRAPYRYLRPLGAKLFLSANADDVREALAAGFPAARVLTESVLAGTSWPHEVRIAFDGDAVIFSDEAEQVFQREGLDAFQQHELSHALQPLRAGPFKPFLAALHLLQQAGTSPMRVRTALVTARSAPAHERAIRTLMAWNIRVDEAMFLGGLPKGEFLREFEPDFFFDDQTGHVDHAARHVPSGHVSAGITNLKH